MLWMLQKEKNEQHSLSFKLQKVYFLTPVQCSWPSAHLNYVVNTRFKGLRQLKLQKKRTLILKESFYSKPVPIYIFTSTWSSKPPDPLPTPLKTVCVPYISGVSESIRRVLGQHNLRTTFRTTNALRSILSHPKSPTPNLEIRSCVLHTMSRLWLALHWGDRSMSVN